MHIHVVKKGETLHNIAEHNETPVIQIRLANGLENPDVLVVGQALVIPDPQREYMIQSGDSLASIANHYGVSVKELAKTNDITDPSLIYIGEMLIIPYALYTIQSGDSLWSIANRYHITIQQLLEANHVTAEAMLYPGQTLRIPLEDRPVTEINAYTTQLNEKGAKEVRALGRNFTYLTPFMYSIKKDGSITSLQEEALIDAAKEHRVAPLLALTNFADGNFDSDLAATILRDKDLQEKLMTHLLETMKAKGYVGVNFDFEYVYPEDRDNYTAFLRRVVQRLHPKGYLVTTSLAPKESGSQKGLLYEAHDYKAHGVIVDFVILMTYEWGWAGGEPTAIAPINRVEKVLDYAMTVIPRDKIMMGIPIYGRDWKIPWQEGTTARTISPYEALNLARQYGAEIQYDTSFASPFFRYTDETGQRHEVWFEDARSMQTKYDAIASYGIRGGSYWVLGNPFPQNWPVLQSHFAIRKL